jgi:cell division protease FtsH
VAQADFAEAIERVVAGLEKKSRVLNDKEKKIVAYHEVGHALVGSLMPGSGKVEKISIVSRGMAALGYTLQLPTEDRFLMDEAELRGQIATLLGGRSAEELSSTASPPEPRTICSGPRTWPSKWSPPSA